MCPKNFQYVKNMNILQGCRCALYQNFEIYLTAREMFYGDSEGDTVEIVKLNSLFPPLPSPAL